MCGTIYNHSLICLYGVVLNYAQGEFYLQFFLVMHLVYFSSCTSIPPKEVFLLQFQDKHYLSNLSSHVNYFFPVVFELRKTGESIPVAKFCCVCDRGGGGGREELRRVLNALCRHTECQSIRAKPGDGTERVYGALQ
jgi:hypothetical protein